MSDPSNRGASKARFFKSSRSTGRPSSARRPFGGKNRLYNVISVRFESSFMRHEYNAQLLDLHDGERVIVETSKGPALATVIAYVQRKVAPTGSLKRVLRIATRDDIRKHMRNRTRQDEAFRFALESIRARELPMKLVQVQIMHDMSKAIFYFSAEGRVDFRELVRDLAGFLKTRIEMRQIGVRDGARMIGGIGSCGRELCCSTFLEQFAPVSIRMAKDQGLTLNPRRVSGVCGRLMCCLVYEQHIYRRARRRLPRAGRRVHTEHGYGVVQSVDVVQSLVSVALVEDGQIEHLPIQSVVLLSTRPDDQHSSNAPKEDGFVSPADRLRNAMDETDSEDSEEYLWEKEKETSPNEEKGASGGKKDSRPKRQDRSRARKGGRSRSSTNDRGDHSKRSAKPKRRTKGAATTPRSSTEGGRGSSSPTTRAENGASSPKQDPAKRRRKRGGRRGKTKPSTKE